MSRFSTGRRREAIAKVERGANPTWMALAELAALHVAATHKEFTSDDVWAELERRGSTTTPDNRALGAVLQQLSRRRVIKATAKWEPSTRAVCHGRPVRVWAGWNR